jgi:NMD protein affecting ribosome stability and mRNA decay
MLALLGCRHGNGQRFAFASSRNVFVVEDKVKKKTMDMVEEDNRKFARQWQESSQCMVKLLIENIGKVNEESTQIFALNMQFNWKSLLKVCYAKYVEGFSY